MRTVLYDVMIRCRSERLPTILQVLEKEMELVSVKVADFFATVPQKSAPAKRFTYVNGKHNKGISGIDLVVELLNAAPGGTASYAKLADAFGRRGFSPKSASPALSALVKDNKVEQLGRGMYRIRKAAA